MFQLQIAHLTQIQTLLDYDLHEQQEDQRYLVSLRNQRTRNSNITFIYSHQITETGAAVLNTSLAQTNLANTLTPVGDVYTDDTLTFNYTKTTTIGDILFSINKSTQDYRTQNLLDVDSTTVSLSPQYNFSQISSINIEASQTLTKYKNIVPQRTDTDNRVRAMYNYNSGKNIVLSLAVTHIKRESLDTARNYEDNNIMLTLSYRTR